MNRTRILFVCILLLSAMLCVGGLSACGDDTPAETTGATDTTAAEATEAPTEPEPTVAATEAPTEPETTPPETTAEETTVEETTPEETTAPETSIPEDETHAGVDILYTARPGSENANKCVVIDAGHQNKSNSEKEPNGPGSTDMKSKVTLGATGVTTGQLEYELNLQVALYLRNELYDRGYNVVMVRETNEVSISNKERAELANAYASQFEEVILIRIHANSFSKPTASGALTMCQTRNNPYPDCVKHYTESRALSELVLDGFCATTGVKKRATPVSETDTMTGINWSSVPATIVEMAFLSNPDEDVLMATDEFRRNAARGIADGVEAYFER